MRKVISYSLWGENPIYFDGILPNYEFISTYFSDYVMRIYVDENLYPLKQVKGLNLEIIYQKQFGNYSGMYWRFFSCEDSNVTLVRDLDSRFSIRELNLVREWEFSGKSFHIIRDHPLHKMPIMGGTWGCKGILKNIKFLIHSYNKFDNYNDDQLFLKDVIFPMIKNDCLEHSSNFIYFTDGYKHIEKNQDGDFIGERMCMNNTPWNIDDRILYLNA